jgi:polyvinyl alcohol dehydrogenase (cytochrome)
LTGAGLAGLVALAALTAAPSTLAAPATPTDPAATSSWPCPHWGMYGANRARTFSTECPSPISPGTVATLVPAWVKKTERTVTASPVVVDGTLFVGDWTGTMFALDAATGAERWRRRTRPAPGATYGPIVSSAAVTDVHPSDGSRRRLVIFGAGPHVYALDAADGTEAWVTHVGGGVPDDPTQVESSPVVGQGVVYIGMDTHDQRPKDTGGVRGGLLALDAVTGAVLWKFEPELGQTGAGCGGVWSSPVLDDERGQVVFATANCPRSEDEFTWNRHTEAVTAVDARTGAVRWTFQPHEPNRQDWDFGATPNLFTDAQGRDILGAGNKDGTYYALDPATGALRWKTEVTRPGDVTRDFSIGGFIGSPAAWRGKVFGGTALAYGGQPYYHALDGATGEVLWRGAAGPSYAASAVVNGVVFAAALDDLLKAYDAATGVPLWSVPLSGPSSSGPAIAGDHVFVGAGTSSSDACAKDLPGSAACFIFFDTVLGATGGIHAFRLAGAGAAGGSPPGAGAGGGGGTPTADGGSGVLADSSTRPPLPATGWPGAAGTGQAALVAVGLSLVLHHVRRRVHQEGSP